MDEKGVVDVLKQVKEVLDKHGIVFWLDGGALLGAVRDGRLIPWDRDIDLAAWDSEEEKAADAFKMLHDKGTDKNYSVVDIHFYHLSNDKAMQTWFVPNQTLIRQSLDYIHKVLSKDYHVVNEGRMPNVITKILYKLVHSLPPSLMKQIDKTVLVVYKKCEKNGCGYLQVAVPSHYFMKFSTIRFYGMVFRVPAETEEYLAYRYGKDWRVPKKNYISGEDDGAICR